MFFNKYDALFVLTVSLALFLNGIYDIKNRKTRSKLVRKFFLDLISESVCEKILLIIGPFTIVGGFLGIIAGLLFLLFE